MNSLPVAALRLMDAWRQAERHVHHMQHAMHGLAPLLPFDEARFAGLTDEQVQYVDQFILRFSSGGSTCVKFGTGSCTITRTILSATQ